MGDAVKGGRAGDCKANQCRLDRDWLTEYPESLRQALASISLRSGLNFHVAGGAVRDWLQGFASNDLDIVVPRDAIACARQFAEKIGGAFVLLDQEEGVARVVWNDFCVDFSDFRENSATIEADLLLRDFSINSMAVAFHPGVAGLAPPYLILDPTGGVNDLAEKKLRALSAAVFEKDPLRLLRAYRFAAVYGFALDSQTEQWIAEQAALLAEPSPERISCELGKIIGSTRSGATISKMEENGILEIVLPELAQGAGVEQPTSHHRDVLGHSLEALAFMEVIQENPGRWFPKNVEVMFSYLNADRQRQWLKWAALLHDIGKPKTMLLRQERITFYNHDREGGRIFAGLARRLRWSREDSLKIGRFIELHMWPFHLSNSRVKTGISPRACLRLVRAIGDDLPGLFLVAMADSLAGQGPEKPLRTEINLAELFDEVYGVYQHSIRPVLEMPRLVNGHDLKKEFGLAPGPLFGAILDAIEEAQVGGEVRNRVEALAWIKTFLEQQSKEE